MFLQNIRRGFSTLAYRIKHDAGLVTVQNKLQTHPIYNSIKTKPQMQLFMESHSFAVWDFMVLLKTLQNKLTCTNQIWLPPKNPYAARLVNSIVLDEESDQVSHDKCMSHFELYFEAMRDIKADTRQIESFLVKISRGKSVHTALLEVNVPDHTKQFVRSTLDAVNQPLHCVASSFYFGREDPIPNMFSKFVRNLPEAQEYENLRLYLDRHIQLDHDTHGPAMEKLLDNLTKGDEFKINKVIESGIIAINHRIKLWDGILKSIHKL